MILFDTDADVRRDETVHIINCAGLHHGDGAARPLLCRLEDEFDLPVQPVPIFSNFYGESEPDRCMRVMAACMHFRVQRAEARLDRDMAFLLRLIDGHGIHIDTVGNRGTGPARIPCGHDAGISFGYPVHIFLHSTVLPGPFLMRFCHIISRFAQAVSGGHDFPADFNIESERLQLIRHYRRCTHFQESEFWMLVEIPSPFNQSVFKYIHDSCASISVLYCSRYTLTPGPSGNPVKKKMSSMMIHTTRNISE